MIAFRVVLPCELRTKFRLGGTYRGLCKVLGGTYEGISVKKAVSSKGGRSNPP